MTEFQQLVNLSEQCYSCNFSVMFGISQNNRLGKISTIPLGFYVYKIHLFFSTITTISKRLGLLSWGDEAQVWIQ